MSFTSRRVTLIATAKIVGVYHETVAAVRAKAETGSEFRHCNKDIGAAGVKQRSCRLPARPHRVSRAGGATKRAYSGVICRTGAGSNDPGAFLPPLPPASPARRRPLIGQQRRNPLLCRGKRRLCAVALRAQVRDHVILVG